MLKQYQLLILPALFYAWPLFGVDEKHAAAALTVTPAAPAAGVVELNLRGWEALVQRLHGDGLDPEYLGAVYSDPRVPARTVIPFSLKPQETDSMYRDFYKKEKLQLAFNFLREHKAAFKEAEANFGVGREVIAALLLVETHCGKALGRFGVLERLSRLATVAEAGNVDYNYERLKKEEVNLKREAVEERARKLEAIFYPELHTLLNVGRKEEWDLGALRGSTAGAFGLGQFLPSSYVRFAVDGNRNGRTSLFEPEDAIFSVANYLASFGWQESLPLDEKRRVIWKYNHSQPYIDAVLDLAAEIKSNRR